MRLSVPPVVRKVVEIGVHGQERRDGLARRLSSPVQHISGRGTAKGGRAGPVRAGSPKTRVRTEGSVVMTRKLRGGASLSSRASQAGSIEQTSTPHLGERVRRTAILAGRNGPHEQVVTSISQDHGKADARRVGQTVMEQRGANERRRAGREGERGSQRSGQPIAPMGGFAARHRDGREPTDATGGARAADPGTGFVAATRAADAIGAGAAAGDAGASGPTEGDVYLDGQVMGRWMMRMIDDELSRHPTRGRTTDLSRGVPVGGVWLGPL